MAKRPTSTIYLAAARDRLLAFLRAGVGLPDACDQVGASLRTVERYMSKHPDFAGKVARAKRGLEVEPEHHPTVEATDPEAPVVDAEVVGSAPCDAEPVSRPVLLPARPARATKVRPAPPPRPMNLGPLTRDEFDENIARVLRDPDHEHFAAMARLVFPFFYGPELYAAKLQIERDADLQPGDKPERVLVIRVRDGRAQPP